jgi:hypothetical protein
MALTNGGVRSYKKVIIEVCGHEKVYNRLTTPLLAVFEKGKGT